jgi:hypothetical protein
MKTVGFFEVFEMVVTGKKGFSFSGFFKEPKNGSSLIIWYWNKYNQWFFFWVKICQIVT